MGRGMADFRIDPGSFSGFSPSAESRTVRQVALRTDKGTLLFRRWAGAWIDFIVLFIVTWAIGALSPPEGWWINPGLVLWAVHFPVCEWRWGRTLGKLATGLVAQPWSGAGPDPVSCDRGQSLPVRRTSGRAHGGFHRTSSAVGRHGLRDLCDPGRGPEVPVCRPCRG